MTQEHPITPPPELVQAFLRSNPVTPDGMTYEEFIATRFARWGADQELEACVEWLKDKEWIHPEFSDELCTARRPWPPSLKELALEAQQRMWNGGVTREDWELGRRALESLSD